MAGKVTIIGGGVAGLSAGVYAAQSGFDTTILEQHSIPGGFCTSWRRKGYLFEGGLHWLSGSLPTRPLNKIWRELGVITDDTKIFVRDPYSIYDHFGTEVLLHRNLEKLQAHFLEIAPEDEKQIKKLCKDIKRFSKVAMPVVDIRGVKVKQKSKMTLGQMLAMLPAFLRMSGYDKYTVPEWARKNFKNPALRGFLENIVGDYYSASTLLFSFGTFTSGDGGYLEGGSLKMAQNIADKFTSLGGKIEYSTQVAKVITEGGKVVGVELVSGEKRLSDHIIITVDTLAAIDKMLEEPLNESWTDGIRTLKEKGMISTFVSLGIEADLSEVPEYVTYELEKPVTIAGTEHKIIGYEHYAKYEGYAPKGCTALTSNLMGDSYDFWASHKEAGTYKEEKVRVGKAVVDLLSEKLPQIKGKVAVVDVATPLTYERYTGSFKGSWMSKIGKGEKMVQYSLKSETIKGLYFAGQRTSPPGGLPTAAESGRRAVQHLCKDTGTIFQGNS